MTPFPPTMQRIAESSSMTMVDLLKPIMKAFDNVLERRFLPIRSISAQVLCRAAAGACCARQRVSCSGRSSSVSHGRHCDIF